MITRLGEHFQGLAIMGSLRTRKSLQKKNRTFLFAGHYSFSFAGKSAERRIPLWLLFIAVQWIDVMW